jgi:hypothetical protein
MTPLGSRDEFYKKQSREPYFFLRSLFRRHTCAVGLSSSRQLPTNQTEIQRSENMRRFVAYEGDAAHGSLGFAGRG